MQNGLRILGHPLHVTILHVPLGLLSTAFIFDIIGLAQGVSIWWTIALANIILGLIVAVPTVVAGFVDYVTTVPGDKPERLATIHMLVNLGAMALFAFSILSRGGLAPPDTLRAAITTALDIGGAVLLGIGGWYGGELVLRHNIGHRAPDEP